MCVYTLITSLAKAEHKLSPGESERKERAPDASRVCVCVRLVIHLLSSRVQWKTKFGWTGAHLDDEIVARLAVEEDLDEEHRGAGDVGYHSRVAVVH